jgi:hypothetical protein
MLGVITKALLQLLLPAHIKFAAKLIILSKGKHANLLPVYLAKRNRKVLVI